MDTSKMIYFRDWKYTLIRNGDHSRFYESNKHFNDSMATKALVFPSSDMSEEEQQEIFNKAMEESQKWRKDFYLGFKTDKNFATGLTKINAYRLLPPSHMEVNPKDLDWQITGKVDSLLGLSVIEAKLNYGGRKWTAWYTPDIPVSDGPYAFSGLPGLIVKIMDDHGWYNFELSGFQNKNLKCFWGEYFIHQNSQAITREKYAEIAFNAQNNPRLDGVERITPEQLLQIKRGASWKYFMLLEQLSRKKIKE